MNSARFGTNRPALKPHKINPRWGGAPETVRGWAIERLPSSIQGHLRSLIETGTRTDKQAVICRRNMLVALAADFAAVELLAVKGEEGLILDDALFGALSGEHRLN